MSEGLSGFALAALLLAVGAVAAHRMRLPPLPAYLAMGLVMGLASDGSSRSRRSDQSRPWG